MVSMTVEQMKRARFSKAAIDHYAGDRWRDREEYPMPKRPDKVLASFTPASNARWTGAAIVLALVSLGLGYLLV